MKTKGNIYLKISGILEGCLGVATIATALVLLSKDPNGIIDLGGINAADSLVSLVWLYAFAGFQIIAGLVGFLNANKPEKAGLCIVFGVLLMIAHLVTLATGNLSGVAATGIVHYIQIVVPLAYLVGAFFNKSN